MVSFQDMQNLALASNMKGFGKIRKSCEQAVRDGYSYVWVDTCCINKESSAELSEAINSMFRWYKASAVCYVFLSDVHTITLSGGTMMPEIGSSRWFTRGWTLQELVAPQHVVFYSQQWEFLGTKQTLSKLLSSQTHIDEAILNGESPSNRTIAQRMSWASHRVTTRVEDTAYCLLGIFDVYMPMLYGEGKRAFLRLQEEIIKRSDDYTIFAWPIRLDDQPGLLADSPAAFADCQHIRSITTRKVNAPFSITNRGLSIKLMATPFALDTYVVALNCVNGQLVTDGSPVGSYRLGIFLRRLNEDDQYARVNQNGNTFVQLKALAWDQEVLKHLNTKRPAQEIEINVRQQVAETDKNVYKDRINGFHIFSEFLEPPADGRDHFSISAFSWHPEERIVVVMKPGDFGTMGFLDFGVQGRNFKCIRIGFDFDHNPVCFIATQKGFKDTHFPRLTDVPQWTDEVAGIHKRTPFDKFAWSKVFNWLAHEVERHPGLWAIKGDRIRGVNVEIHNLVSLQIIRGEFQNKLVWNLYLRDIEVTGKVRPKP
ncbi:hypothetical protein VE01_07792 [Pseudogymnoascus verrucosus]|uniref:Uncharacterized protein n=1 Tax=Pseudogymnoascus verrucosus TaxID=342668 RepID=A0A1B8GEJ1_9PEZI|nr:uncharacterized protein VE01_07792 [Pseudogymnoascus verrucosus]OBT94247.1 hypothetical protein VE01_07792 [Pseudogymnoascus verrucosus]